MFLGVYFFNFSSLGLKVRKVAPYILLARGRSSVFKVSFENISLNVLAFLFFTLDK